MIVLVLSMLLPVANAACPDPTPMSELTASVDDSLLSFATLDEEGFIESSDTLIDSVPCLSEVIGAPDAASIHRSLAMRAFWDGDDDKATAFFRAARRIEPDHILSNKIAPEGGPLATLYDGANRRTVRMTSLDAPSWTTVYVDGERASQRPDGVPAVFQYEVSGEGVVWTGLVEADAELPSLDAARAMRGGSPVPDPGTMARPEPVETPDPVQVVEVPDGNGGSTQIEDIDASSAVANNSGSTRDRDERRSRDRGDNGGGGGGAKGPLIGATVATGVIAAGLFGVSAYSRSEFDKIPTESRYNLTNATFFGSVGAAAVTAGLLTATIAVK